MIKQPLYPRKPKRHKFIVKSKPTRHQKDAVSYHYLCNPSIKCDYSKTDMINKKVTCKRCLVQLRKKYYEERTKKDNRERGIRTPEVCPY